MGKRSEDTSVMMALSELESIERARIADERRRAEDSKRAEQARAAAAREAEQHASRVAEAEARVRVERDLQARDADAERRLEAMRRELAAIQEERERLHDRVAVGALEASAMAEPPRRGLPRGLGLVFGSAGLVAGGLALLVALTPAAPVVQTRVVEVPVAVAAPSAPAPVIEPAVVAAEPVVEVASGPARPHPHGKVRPIVRQPVVPGAPHDPDLEAGDSDPLGGVLEDSRASSRRPRGR